MIMTDIDAALARLREMPVHPGLGSIDAAILDGIAAGVRQPLSGSVVGMAALAALAIGMAGSLIPGASVTAAPVAPFGASPALAPSTLLGGGE